MENETAIVPVPEARLGALTVEPEQTLGPESLAEWAADCFAACGTLSIGQAKFVMDHVRQWERERGSR